MGLNDMYILADKYICNNCGALSETRNADCESGSSACNGNHTISTRIAIMISRHEPNDSQRLLAAKQGYTLIHVGDMDAFAPNLWGQIRNAAAAECASAVVAVHPLVALTATGVYTQHHYDRGFLQPLDVLIFQNATRPAPGQVADYTAGGLSIFSGSSVNHYHPNFAEKCHEAADAEEDWK